MSEIYNLDTVVKFGKHNGKSISEIIQENPTYIYWMYENKFPLSLEVRRASNDRTQERRKEAGLSPMKERKLGSVEINMLNNLKNHLDDTVGWKHQVFDDENIDLY